jgi:hypothetical protein
MPDAAYLIIDLVAILVLAGGVYFRRHQRRDMVLAYVSLNVGVLAVATALTSAPFGAGLGLGLFGVLSIIRLRSSELTQEEVAYYFVSLALGLVAGLQPTPAWTFPAMAALLVCAMAVLDHPRLLPTRRHQRVTLDAAITDETQLVARLEELLGGDVRRIVVEQVDLVRDLTIVDVRYRTRTSADHPLRNAVPVL